MSNDYVGVDYRGDSTECEWCAELTESYCEECEEDFAFNMRQDWDDEEMSFADPTGHSALRAATANNPRNVSCPTCHAPNRLTPADQARGYQCDSCADKLERGLDF